MRHAAAWGSTQGVVAAQAPRNRGRIGGPFPSGRLGHARARLAVGCVAAHAERIRPLHRPHRRVTGAKAAQPCGHTLLLQRRSTPVIENGRA